MLAQLDAQLTAAGSGRGRILNATIYLPDPADLAAFNALWDGGFPPGRRRCGPASTPPDRSGHAHRNQMVAAAGG